MRICPCPVWILSPEQSERFSRIVAASDPSPESEEKAGLNRRIVEMAWSLSKQEDAELHILHAWSAFGASLLRNRTPEDRLEQYVSDCEAAARKCVDQFLGQFPKLADDAEVHLPRGEPHDAIIDFAAARSIDLVVMGAVCRTGIAGYVIGNTAEKVLGRIDNSVLTVKPPCFRSPVDESPSSSFVAVEQP
jgi:nucleotide-binding universal stress UspA family protein